MPPHRFQPLRAQRRDREKSGRSGAPSEADPRDQPSIPRTVLNATLSGALKGAAERCCARWTFCLEFPTLVLSLLPFPGRLSVSSVVVVSWLNLHQLLGRSARAMVLLESEQFLTELTRLFQKCRTTGSVYITLKKYDGRTRPIPRKGHLESFEPVDNKCLLRATDGKKKISTVVSSREVNKFQMAYSNLIRANMDGLKKKDKKSKNKKSKATQ
ncbi:signal recognition particle 14 kDa protein [Crotalus adamanteus]